MKKVVKGLLTLFVAFIGLNSVKAISSDTSIIYNKSKDQVLTIDYINIRTTNSDNDGYLVCSEGRYCGYDSYSLNQYSIDGEYTAYCLDPHLGSTNTYRLERILGESDDETENAYDYAILDILKNASTQLNNSYTLSDGRVISGDDLYIAASLAIRALDLGVLVMVVRFPKVMLKCKILVLPI